MNKTTKQFAISGSIMMILAIIIGAFGAHALKEILDAKMLNVYNTGVEYHFYHALGLFCVAFISSFSQKSKLVKIAGYFMIMGIILFSGSLYTLSLTNISYFGMITPIGGVSFIISWGVLIASILLNENYSCTSNKE